MYQDRNLCYGAVSVQRSHGQMEGTREGIREGMREGGVLTWHLMKGGIKSHN